MKTRSTTILIGIVFTLVISGVFYFQGHAILDVFEKTQMNYAIYLILLNIPYVAANGLAFDCLCYIYGIRLRWLDWIGVSFIANFINQCLPYRPGMAFRFFYFRQHYHMTFVQFSFLMLLFFSIMLLCGLIFSGIGWMIIDIPKKQSEFFLIVSVTFVGLVGLFWVFKKIGFSIVQQHMLPVLSSLIVLTVMHFLGACLFFTGFYALSYPVSFFDCVFMIGVLSVSSIFPITPANIGVSETLLGTLTQLLYNDFSIGFAVMTLCRASQWVISVMFGGGFSFILMGHFFPKMDQNMSKISEE